MNIVVIKIVEVDFCNKDCYSIVKKASDDGSVDHWLVESGEFFLDDIFDAG